MSEAAGIKQGLDNLIRMAIALFGLVLFAFVLLFFAREGTKMHRLAICGSLRTDISDHAAPGDTVASPVTVQRIDASDFAGLPLPAIGDTIILIDDSLATVERAIRLWMKPLKESTPHELVWISKASGDTLRNQTVVHGPDPAMLRSLIVLQVLRFLVSFAFISVGLWAFFARPNVGAVRVFVLFCLAMSAFMVAGVQALSGAYATFAIPFLDQIIRILSIFATLFAAFWLHLSLLFPRPLALIERRPWLQYVLSYGPILLYFGLGALTTITRTNFAYFVLGLTVMVAAGFWILGWRARRATDLLEKRQTKLVVWGTGLALGWLGITVIVASFFRDWFGQHQQVTLFVLNVAFLVLLLAPLSFLYAFNRWRLLDIEAKLRRGTRYILVTAASIVLFVLIGLGIGLLVGGNVGRENQLIVTVVVICMTALAIPAQKRLQVKIEQKIYPERERLRQLIRDFLQRALLLPDKVEFWSQLEGRLQEGLLVESIYPIVRGSEASYWLKGHQPTPFGEQSDFLARLERESRPLLVDEVLASEKVRVRDDEATWLTNNKVALVLPLVSQQKLVGFIGIGSKVENEDYSAEELRILDSLAPQIAVASENIRLIEENVGKQRLEEQMRMARQIQQGFLPQHLPQTPGLEIAVRSKFSLEVAGDYHDVIDLETGETVVAVGDVSGKGAGAALLMANLQASLRTAIGVGVPISATVARVNNLIYRNTPPEQYITFFVGVFNPRFRTFTYVNAGHNPPILLRGSGEVELLDEGGLILGCVDGVAYQEATIPLRIGDVLILFTDGVSEAMDTAEQEYGEDRLRDYAKALRHLRSQDIAEELEQSVISHRGKDQFDDDFTLMIVRGV